ncbi:diguanylate cyclase [Halothiobacillus sp.]|uniref:GGDEF domain-containing protein n=1 Tax=Halothiobacillus sp. TaxID=1891311 RepID=UPI002AD46F81|nr:diguanylate cyclase [Halothiobacillus sp.]
MSQAHVKITPAEQPDTRLIHGLVWAKNLALLISAPIAFVTFLAWVIPVLAIELPDGWSLMKANTALVTLLSALSLVLLSPGKERRRLSGRVLALLVFVIAATALLAHGTGHSYSLETWLAADPLSEHPGRMSAQTATFFLLLASALVLDMPQGPKWCSRILDGVTLLLLVIVLVIMAGYLFGALNLVGQSLQVRTAPQTLIGMTLLAFSLFVHRTQAGCFAVFVGRGLGSRIARTALPLAVLLPFLVIGGGAYSTLSGWMSIPFAAALVISMTSLLLFVFVVLMARRINELERELRELSLTDELTKVYNRRGFYLFGEHALYEGQTAEMPLTILYFDLDGLKSVNDTLGHDAGSQLVQDFAYLLLITFRRSDVVARVGGDEFAVVAREPEPEILLALKRLNAAIVVENEKPGRRYRISYSMGSVTSQVSGEETFDELVARADALMYERKRIRKASEALEVIVSDEISSSMP